MGRISVKLFLVTEVKFVSRNVHKYWFMARVLTVECFELTAASDQDDIKFGSPLASILLLL